jgi:hypothetical protein
MLVAAPSAPVGPGTFDGGPVGPTEEDPVPLPGAPAGPVGPVTETVRPRLLALIDASDRAVNLFEPATITVSTSTTKSVAASRNHIHLRPTSGNEISAYSPSRRPLPKHARRIPAGLHHGDRRASETILISIYSRADHHAQSTQKWRIRNVDRRHQMRSGGCGARARKGEKSSRDGQSAH